MKLWKGKRLSEETVRFFYKENRVRTRFLIYYLFQKYFFYSYRVRTRKGGLIVFKRNRIKIWFFKAGTGKVFKRGLKLGRKFYE